LIILVGRPNRWSNLRYAALREEFDANAEISGEKLQSLPVLTGIIKETLRISSTVPCKLPRVTPPEGMVFEETFIPGGVVVGVAPYILHMDEKVFPDPHTFRYERWHDATAEMNRDWMPFGKGARACMGRHLALMQLYIAVSSIVKSGVLDEARTVKPSIEFWQWYNVKVQGAKVEIVW
jgi:cytochrome P450